MAELLRLEREAQGNVSVADVVEMISGLEDEIGDLLARLEKVEAEVQRLRDDVDYLLTKCLWGEF